MNERPTRARSFQRWICAESRQDCAQPGSSRTPQTLLALRGGARPEEHESPGASTLQVLRGRVRVVAGDQAWQLRQGDHLKLPDERHRLDGVEDAVILLTVAMSG